MECIETPTFTRLMTSLLHDDEYRQLQNPLLERPDAGVLIKGGGGIRKVRFAMQGSGKSSGMRIIYYWIKDKQQIYMLLAYAKSKSDTLSDQQTASLYALVKDL